MQVSLRILSFFSITLALFVVGTGQVKQESFKAFSKLADRIESYTKDDTKKSFRIASVTVESKTDSTAVLQLSIGGSSELTRFEFITVEAESAILANGTFQSVSKPNRIQAAAVMRTDLASDQAFYKPSMVIKTSREANYVIVRVFGVGRHQDTPFTYILPLREGIKSGVISEVSSIQSQILEDACSWFVGHCDDCTVCIGCGDNSPVLNCVECTMTCANGEPCSPSTPKPVNCP